MASSTFNVRFNMQNNKARPSSYKVPGNSRPSSYKSSTSVTSRPSSFKREDNDIELEKSKSFFRPSSFKIIEGLARIPVEDRTVTPSTDFLPSRPSTEYIHSR